MIVKCNCGVLNKRYYCSVLSWLRGCKRKNEERKNTAKGMKTENQTLQQVNWPGW